MSLIVEQQLCRISYFFPKDQCGGEIRNRKVRFICFAPMRVLLTVTLISKLQQTSELKINAWKLYTTCFKRKFQNLKTTIQN